MSGRFNDGGGGESSQEFTQATQEEFPAGVMRDLNGPDHRVLISESLDLCTHALAQRGREVYPMVFRQFGRFSGGDPV